ncbi:MAG TPA: glycosyltransferase family 2 protein [Pirellulales bacterium]|jgi:glycosyltransferase involved in cell wall biosynthesis|nr:glycosyltransferase family 2 protein [Pirellulales bacterium]
MSMQQKVSVLIPVYNRADSIARCIESALAQTHTNLEIIVSDNASTDDTWSVVNRLAATDSRIRPFQNETNIGPTRNWICGLERCTGDYVKILFSDDWIEAHCVEALLGPMEEKPEVHLAFSAAMVHYADRDEPKHHFPDQRWFSVAEYLHDALLRGLTPVSPCCALVRRTAARFRLPIGDDAELNQIAKRFGAGPDLLFLLEAAAESSEVAHVPKFLTHFAACQSSITVNHAREVQAGYRLVRDYFAAQMADRHGLARINMRFKVRRWQRALKRALHL